MTDPERGGIVEGDFSPDHGHGLARRGPAIVVSEYGFNSHSGMTAVVPVTAKNNGYPLHIDVGESPVRGYVRVGQLRRLDLSARGHRPLGATSREAMFDVMPAIRGMFELR